jgi:hypothetical protein
VADTIETALKRLQHTARERRKAPLEPGHSHKWFSTESPDGEGSVAVDLYDDGVETFEEVCDLLADDLRFEYADRASWDKTVRRFVARATVERGKNHVPAFVREHAREPGSFTCTFTVEDLVVPEPTELFGATFLPAEEVEAPPTMGSPDPHGVQSLIEVRCEGTGGPGMLRRARDDAELALRLLRMTLAHRFSPSQLRVSARHALLVHPGRQAIQAGRVGLTTASRSP